MSVVMNRLFPMYAFYLSPQRPSTVLILLPLLYLTILITAFPSVDHVNITERAGQFPDFPDTYEGRVARGEYLRELMSLDSAAATQKNNGIDVASKFQDPRETQRWGWVRIQEWYPFTSSGTLRSVCGPSVEMAFQDEAHPVDKRHAGLFCWMHYMDFVYEDGTRGKANNGHFCNVMIPQSNAIVFDNNISPQSMVTRTGTGNVPDLGKLSDISFLQWLDACERQNVDPKALKLMFRARLAHLPTLELMKRVLREAGYTKVPGWRHPARVDINSPLGAAILGSASGSSSAWFLIQHKEKLGVKRITEAVIWGTHYSFYFILREGFPFDMSLTSSGRPSLNIRFTIEDVQ